MEAVEPSLSALFYPQPSDFIGDEEYIFPGNCRDPHSMGKTEIKRDGRRQQRKLQPDSFDAFHMKPSYSRDSSTGWRWVRWLVPM